MSSNKHDVRQARVVNHARAGRGPSLLASLLSSAAIAALALMPDAAHAQSTWAGTTSDYNITTNWTPNTVPASSGQSAVFDAGGSNTINVSSPVSPDSWTFDSSSQSYTFTGSAVTFGTATGIQDNAVNQLVSIANNLGGIGGISINGSDDTIKLSGNNTYSGATNIAAGTLQTLSTTALSASSDFTVNGGIDLHGFSNSIGSLSGTSATALISSSAGSAVLTTGTNGTTIYNGRLLNGAGTLGLTVGGTGTLVLTGNDNAYTGATTINSGATLQLGNNTIYGNLIGVTAVTNNGTLAFNFSSTTTFANNISGTGGVTDAGTGTLVLQPGTANTYSGLTVINSGATLQAGNANAFATTGTLSDFTVNGTLDLNGFAVSANSLTGSGTVTNNGGADATLTAGTSGTTTFSGALQDGGTNKLGLTVAGNGTLILTGANTYSGATTINNGITLQAGSPTAFSAGSDYTVSGTLDLHGFSNSIGSLAGAGTVTNNGNADAVLTVGGNNNSAVFGGILRDGSTNKLGLTVTGTGTLTLTGANTYTGNTTVNSGATLTLSSAGTVASSGLVTVNGTFDVHGAIGTVAIKSLAGSGSVVTGASILGNTLFISSASTEFSGAITDNGTFQGLEIGGGTQTLSGVNSYENETQIDSGATLALKGIGSIATSSSVGMTSGTLDISQTTSGTTISTVSGTGTIALGSKTLTITSSGLSFDGVIQDGGIGGGTGGGITLANGSDQLLSNANTYTGATTINPGGELDLVGGSGSHSGSIANSAQVIDNGTFDISGITVGNTTIKSLTGSGTLNLGSRLLIISAANGTYSGNITGSGAGVNLTGGTMIFTGSAGSLVSFSVGSGTTLQIGNGGTSGSTGGFEGIVDDGSLIFDHSNAITVTDPITGSGSLTQAGTGTLVLSVSNSYSGLTTISSGTLALGAAGGLAIENSSGIVDNGVLDISGSALSGVAIQSFSGTGTVLLGSKSFTIEGSGTFSGAITGTGSITLNSGGTEIFSGSNSYTGGTTVSNGTLQVGNGGTTGNLGSGAITNYGTLAFDRSDAVTLSNAISGYGTLTQAGSGTLILTGVNSYDGTTVISSGILQVGSGGTAGSLGTGAITDNATLAFNRSDNITVANVISGTGALTQAGSGTVILTGANTYTGTTTVNAGSILQIGAGGTAGSIAGGAITNNGTLAFDRSDTVTTANVISGTGGLTQSGTGTLILNGASTYTGTTNVMSGTLEIGDAAHPNASVGGSVNVQSGAALYGHGIVNGNVGVVAGGTLRPGGTIGTLTVNGNLSLPAGSTLVAELSPTAADRVTVGGAATLGGNLQLIADPGTYTAGTDFKLISASSVSGTFASVTGQVAGFVNTVQYSATGVDLILSNIPATTFLFGSYGTTANQAAAGNALTASSSTGALYTALGALVGSSTASVPGALGQLAGDIRPSLRAAAIEDSRMIRDTLLDHMDQTGSGMTIWGAGFAGYGGLTGNGNATSLHHDNAGFLAGIDMPVMPDVTLGADAGYSSNSAHTPGRVSAASGDNGHVGAYASFHPGDVRFAIGGDYGFGTVTINRAVPALGLSTTDSEDQRTGQVFADLGYHIGLDGIALEPHAGIAHIVATGGAFAETGGIAALSGGEKSDSETYSMLGLRAGLAGMALDDDLTLTPRFDLGWQHALARLTPYQTVSYVSAGTSFTVLGTPLAQDAAALEAGFDLKLAPSASLFITYDGSFSSTVENHAFRGGLSWQF